MDRTFTPTARRLGIAAAAGTVILCAAYAATLAAGLASLPSPRAPIGDPLFSVLEVLILLVMPCMIALAAAIHAWADAERKVEGLLALVFTACLGGVTMALHFAILALSHRPDFAAETLVRRQLSFEWPSLAYVVDILAWDVLFALGALFAARVFRGGRLARAIRALLATSGVLALAGLTGVFAGDMRWRMLGVAGYSLVFPVAAALVGVLFRRTPARAA